MTPYEQIEEAKKEALRETFEVCNVLQNIAGKFREKTGLCITGFSFPTTGVTEMGKQKETFIRKPDISFDNF
jgi:hypothetical protein